MNSQIVVRRLYPAEIEKVFVQAVIDVEEILVIDGTDRLDSPPGFRIRTHDLYGALPDVMLEDTGDRCPVLDRISVEAAKLITIVRVRRKLEQRHEGCEFLLPTLTDSGLLVGIRIGGSTVLAEAPTFWEAYHELDRKLATRMV